MSSFHRRHRTARGAELPIAPGTQLPALKGEKGPGADDWKAKNYKID